MVFVESAVAGRAVAHAASKESIFPGKSRGAAHGTCCQNQGLAAECSFRGVDDLQIPRRVNAVDLSLTVISAIAHGLLTHRFEQVGTRGVGIDPRIVGDLMGDSQGPDGGVFIQNDCAEG